MRMKPTLTQAQAQYVHRYTVEHVPQWAKQPAPNGKYYAPQYATDAEWYEHTLFPPDNPFHDEDCHSTGQTWPLGQWLDKPLSGRNSGCAVPCWCHDATATKPAFCTACGCTYSWEER